MGIEDDIRAALKRATESGGLTQGQIAEAAGTHDANLSRFKDGKKSLSLKGAEELAGAMGYRLSLVEKVKRRSAKKKGGK